MSAMLKSNLKRHPLSYRGPFKIERSPSCIRRLVTFREAVPEFITLMTAQTRVSLERFESNCFSRWVEKWCSMPLAHLSTGEILAYFAELESQGFSRIHLEREKRLLRSFFRLARRRGACDRDPMDSLESSAPSAPTCVFWSQEEEQRVLNACRGIYPPGTSGADSLRRPPVPPPYLQPLVLLGLRTGLKLDHLLGLEWPQVDLQGSRILIGAEVTWSGHALEVALDADAKTTLLDLQREAQAAPVMPRRIFEAVGLPLWKDRPDDFAVLHAFLRILKTALVEESDFDVVRLSYARRCAEQGLPLLHPARQGDWEDATLVQEVYRRVSGDA